MGTSSWRLISFERTGYPENENDVAPEEWIRLLQDVLEAGHLLAAASNFGRRDGYGWDCDITVGGSKIEVLLQRNDEWLITVTKGWAISSLGRNAGRRVIEVADRLAKGLLTMPGTTRVQQWTYDAYGRR